MSEQSLPSPAWYVGEAPIAAVDVRYTAHLYATGLSQYCILKLYRPRSMKYINAEATMMTTARIMKSMFSGLNDFCIVSAKSITLPLDIFSSRSTRTMRITRRTDRPGTSVALPVAANMIVSIQNGRMATPSMTLR